MTLPSGLSSNVISARMVLAIFCIDDHLGLDGASARNLGCGLAVLSTVKEPEGCSADIGNQ